MDEVQVFAVTVVAVTFAIIALVKLVLDTSAIRRMLEGQGLLSNNPCPSCRMSVPSGASVCGHCGRDLEPMVAP